MVVTDLDGSVWSVKVDDVGVSVAVAVDLISTSFSSGTNGLASGAGLISVLVSFSQVFVEVLFSTVVVIISGLRTLFSGTAVHSMAVGSSSVEGWETRAMSLCFQGAEIILNQKFFILLRVLSLFSLCLAFLAALFSALVEAFGFFEA